MSRTDKSLLGEEGERGKKRNDSLWAHLPIPAGGGGEGGGKGGGKKALFES